MSACLITHPIASCPQDDASDEEDDDPNALPSDPFWDNKAEEIKHLNGILKNFRPVDLLDNSAGTAVGILKTLLRMLSDEWLGGQASHADLLILLNADIAVVNRVLHFIFTEQKWQDDPELQALVDDADTETMRALRHERIRTCLENAKASLAPPRTSARLADAINEALAETTDAEESQAADIVTESSLSRFLNAKYYYNGPLVQKLERFCRLCDDWEEPEGGEGDAGEARPPPANLQRLREMLTRNVVVISDTFHPGAHHSQAVYQHYRLPVYKRIYKAIFKKGGALRTRKLVQLRWVNLLLRLGYTDAVREALEEWYSNALEETGVSDPRAEMLVALFELHLPLAALWERALLHGTGADLLHMLPDLFLVRSRRVCVLWT